MASTSVKPSPQVQSSARFVSIGEAQNREVLVDVPGATDAQSTTLRLIGEGLIALTEGSPRSALDYLLESLPGLPSIGGSRVQQEVILETALAAMLQLGAPGQAARLLSRYRATPGPLVTRGAVN